MGTLLTTQKYDRPTQHQRVLICAEEPPESTARPLHSVLFSKVASSSLHYVARVAAYRLFKQRVTWEIIQTYILNLIHMYYVSNLYNLRERAYAWITRT